MKKLINREFIDIISDLLETEEIQRLKQISHHNTTRYQHCLEVAYRGYVWAKFLGYDYVSTARAGLLHDLFFYDTSNCPYTMREHLRIHPQIALENARKITTINKVEENIILSHMYLVANEDRPVYPESKIICAADKYSSMQEKLHWFQFKDRCKKLLQV